MQNPSPVEEAQNQIDRVEMSVLEIEKVLNYQTIDPLITIPIFREIDR
jgi:hypothetical protein